MGGVSRGCHPCGLKPYADQERWVVWRFLKKKGSHEATKIPYQARKPSVTAASNDSSTWADAATAIKAAEDGNFNGIGICLLNSNIVAFDIDDCRDPKTGEIDPYVVKLIERAKTYCEITPSETGLRIIGIGSGARFTRSRRSQTAMASPSRPIGTVSATSRSPATRFRMRPLHWPTSICWSTPLWRSWARSKPRQKKSDGAAKAKTQQRNGELPASLTTRLFIPDLGVNCPTRATPLEASC